MAELAGQSLLVWKECGFDSALGPILIDSEKTFRLVINDHGIMGWWIPTLLYGIHHAMASPPSKESKRERTHLHQFQAIPARQRTYFTVQPFMFIIM